MLKISWILLFSSLIAQPAATQVRYGNNSKAGRYVAVGNIKLYCEIYGKGDPLLLIHKNGGSIEDFSNNIPHFAGLYSVIAVDSRAHGKSADAGDSLTFEMMADDFNALLDSLHLDNCYVIGWSDGGISGLLLAIRHPGKVRKLAITGANLWPDTTAITSYVFHKLIAESNRVHALPATLENRNALKINDLNLLEPHIRLSQLEMIQCPTLVIGGDHDVIPVLHTALIAQHIKLSDLWIIPDSGHSTPVYKKDQFNLIVTGFFQRPYRKIEGEDTFN